MSEPKRARDVRIGDTLPDGSVVYSVNRNTHEGYNILSRRQDGSLKRSRYAPETIIPGPDERYPSRFVGGHPWARKGRIRRSQGI